MSEAYKIILKLEEELQRLKAAADKDKHTIEGIRLQRDNMWKERGEFKEALLDASRELQTAALRLSQLSAFTAQDFNWPVPPLV